MSQNSYFDPFPYIIKAFVGYLPAYLLNFKDQKFWKAYTLYTISF